MNPASGSGGEAAPAAGPAQVCRWHAVSELEGLHVAAAAHILGAADRALRARHAFHVVLSGGNTPRETYRRLRGAATDWSEWHIYFGDERCLPPEDASRNSRMAGEAWLDHVPIPASHRHSIPAERDPQEAALAYAATLRSVGEFDLVLLGLGEDGHTAGLFPGHAWGEGPGSASVLAVYDAPKPPARRVSMSAVRLSAAREVLFLVSGNEKRMAVARWRAGDRIPARSIAPAAGVDILVEAALIDDRQARS